jgi:biopolymer transport protein ExbB
MLNDILDPLGLAEKGGPVIWLQVALALLGFLFVVERLFYFHRARINVGDLLVGLSHHVRRKAYAEALHESARTPGPVARVAHSILKRHDLVRSDLRDIAQEAGQLEVPRIEKNIRVILAVAMTAPLLGMLGTVLGLTETFQRMTEHGGYAGPAELSAGILQALITTALGMTISIPTYLFYLYFLSRSKRLLHRIERTGIEMVNMICDARAETEIVSIRDEIEARRQRERLK